MFVKTFLVLAILLISHPVESRAPTCRRPRQREIMTVDAASILLPLYVYPSAGAWEPLVNVATSYPRMQFTVIVNPHSGPGEGELPNVNYTEALRTLNLLNNVRTIGYVATTWSKKGISMVLDEIASYAGWGVQDPSLALHGIFFDETVTKYTPDSVKYLRCISHAVRTSDGLADGFVVHNPGALPDAEYFNDPKFEGTADLTVVFEDSYNNWLVKANKLTEDSFLYDHRSLSCLLHSVPSLSSQEMETLLQEIMSVGRSVYLTGTKNYTRIDSYFPVFVDCLNQLLDQKGYPIWSSYASKTG